MNKLVLLIFVLAILVGGYMFVRPQSAPTPKTSPTALEELPDSRYAQYTTSAFDQASDKKRVYFFHAPWCPTCISADKEFQVNQTSIPEDVVLFKTDFDSSSQLKKQYAVTYQHTFVLVDENGKEIRKWNGGALNELIANTR